MDNRRKRMRDIVAALRRELEGGPGGGDGAWAIGLTLALEAAMAVRGIAGPSPEFFAAGGALPAATGGRCRALLAGGKELFAAPDALGWVHQFWHSGERASLAGRTRGDQCVKIGAAAVVPVTQVYSEPYMVAFLAENSLGALWLAGHPGSPLTADWRYYVRTPADGKGRKRAARELTVCDPACGAGNFLLAAFDMLYGMYREEGAGEPAAICAAIINDNLYGADIDAGAVAVTRAALWLRAKERAPGLEEAALPGLTDNIVAAGGPDAELGSLRTTADASGPLRRLLSRRYAVVMTNPPYLDKRDYAKSVRSYLRRHYAAGAGNLYAAFILRCLSLAEDYAAMVTPQTFLFIRSYAKLRSEVLGRAPVRTLAHLGLGAFADAVVDAALFVLAVGADAGRAGVYFKLLAAPRKAEALAEAVRGHNAGEDQPETFVRTPAEVSALPGGPLAYWLGDGLRTALASARPLGESADIVLGMKTADNARFVRRWWEVWGPGGAAPGWVPYEKEASGYRYARAAAHYVRWTAAAQAHYRSHYSAQLPNRKYWFRGGLVYGLISSKAFSAKLLPAGCMTDMAASCVFPADPDDGPFLLGLLNAKVYQCLLKMFNPTVNYQPVDLQRLPLPAVPAAEKAETGRLALVAAAAAGELRAAEITDCGFVFAPEEWLPLAERLPERAMRLWLASLRQLLAADAIDRLLARVLGLSAAELRMVAAEVGQSPDELPALAGYEAMPDELRWDGLPSPGAVRKCGRRELSAVKDALRRLYYDGPGRSRLPEEFFASLVARMRLHPITIYNLLKEGIGREGWRCPALAKGMALDFASAAVLAVLGHAWPGRPAQAEPGAMAPAALFAALGGLDDGLAADFAVFAGVPLDLWLGRRFFAHHVARFKRRPVVWQLAAGSRKANALFHWRLAGELAGEPDYAFQPDWGVRVNAAPLQAAGKLAAPVLPDGELARALEDWRRCRAGEYML